MKIAKVTATRVRIPTRVRYEEAGGTYTSFVRSLVVEVSTEEGVTGVGDVHESVPGYTHETLETMHALVTTTYGPALIGCELDAVESLHTRMLTARRGNGFARCALEIAVFDALARSRKTSVCALLGGPVRRELQLVGGIGIDEPDIVAKRAAGMVEAGYRTIKLKIGTNVREDIARVRQVRSVVGDAIAIRVDANAGYSAPDALLAVRALADLQIEHFEQPVAAEDFDTMARLTRLGAVSILADESMHTAHDAMRVVQAGAADGMKIKISKVGGFIEARKIIDVAEAAGIKVIIGNGICSSIEAAAELQLACAYGHLHSVAEMVGPAKLAGDLAEKPFDLSGGTIRLEDGVGLGVTLSHDRLREYAIR